MLSEGHGDRHRLRAHGDRGGREDRARRMARCSAASRSAADLARQGRLTAHELAVPCAYARLLHRPPAPPGSPLARRQPLLYRLAGPLPEAFGTGPRINSIASLGASGELQAGGAPRTRPGNHWLRAAADRRLATGAAFSLAASSSRRRPIALELLARLGPPLRRVEQRRPAGRRDPSGTRRSTAPSSRSRGTQRCLLRSRSARP